MIGGILAGYDAVLITDSTIDEQAWSDVLQAMDRTYAELVDYQEQLEVRNAELTNLRHFLASIMSSISDFLVVSDREGRIANASLSFQTAVGATTDAIAAQQICDFFDGDDRDLVKGALASCVASKQDVQISASLVTMSGKDPVEIRISPRLDRRKKCTGVILIGRPMGELLRAYSELETSHRELKEAQGQLVRNEKMASLGRLLAGVAHELNNPISFVYANTHTLDKYLNRFETYFEKVQAGASREELIALRHELHLDRQLGNLRNAVQGARDGAERVRDIVEDLRRLSADGSGEIVVLDLLQTAKVSANWVKRGTKSDVEITYEGEADCLVNGRPGHLQQVLMNLIQNAVDAMEGIERPRIRITAAYRNGHAVLEVCDFGKGVPPELAQTIFDPFFTTKEVGKGTGLGLSISHKIVEEHGGRLELVDQADAGACFRITLPKGGEI